MEKMVLCTKRFADEENAEYILHYALLTSSVEQDKFYGIEVEMTDGQNVVDKDVVAGLSEHKKEVEKFIRKLWAATALPVELAALCDDFISEREWLGKYKAALAAS